MPRATLKKRSDGRYKCKYKGIQFYGATQREAMEAREAYKRTEAQGVRNDDPTVSEYAARWLPIYRPDVGQKTYNDYANQINVLCQIIGDKTLRSVKPTDIKEVYKHYVGYSDSTIKRAKILFVGIFESAIADGYIRVNPCKDKTAKPHKGTVGTHRAITDEERHLIHQTEHRLRPAVMTMLYAGLRRGEAMAMNIDQDVDFNAKEIRVTQAVRFDGNQPIVTDPKTGAGTRTVPLLAVLAAELDGHHGLLLPSAKGELCTDTAFRRAWDSYLHALSITAGRPVNLKPHDLRHSYCTMLRDTPVDIKLAMEWMGHADKDMILKVYDHITPGRVERSIKALNAFSKEFGVQNGVQKQIKSDETIIE